MLPKPRLAATELLIPLAIVIAGLIVAVAVYVDRVHHIVQQGTGNPSAVRAISPDDHIVGNPAAPVAIIEYADIDSTYTKQFQPTMEQLMAEYAAGGKVAWVFREFPLTMVHANSASDALAAECVASLSSSATFFQFIDAIQAAAPGSEEFNPAGYGAILNQLGVDQGKFVSCMTNGTYEKRIASDYDNALASGATGSPYVILIVHGQKPTAISGAVPYASLKKIVDGAIAKAGS